MPNQNFHYRGDHAEGRKEPSKVPFCIRGIWKSREGISCCILSTDLTEPRPWIAQCPLRGRANWSLIPLHSGPVRVTRTICWQQGNTPADPMGVRSLRNLRVASLTTDKKKKVGLKNAPVGKCSKWDRFENGCSQSLKIKELSRLRAICVPWSLAREK